MLRKTGLCGNGYAETSARILSAIAVALSRGQPFDLYGDGTHTRGWTYVSDVVEATIAAMESGRGTYNVGGAAEVSLRDAIGLLERLAGRSLAVREQAAAPGDMSRTNADTSRIRTELGWEPRVPLEDGLRAQWDWASENAARLAATM